MKAALIRTARTFVQTFLGVYLTGQFELVGDFVDVDLLSSAAAAGIVAVLTLAQNLVENQTSVSYDKG